MLYIQSTVGGFERQWIFFLSIKALLSKLFFSNPLQNKTKFSSGRNGCRVNECEFWWRTAAQESKKSAMFQNSEASSATTIHYGLCLGLVLSGKPHLGTNIWRFLARLDPEGRGAQTFAMVLCVKGLDRGLWVKCTNSREYCNLIDQPCSR